jgi:hypothetical protein
MGSPLQIGISMTGAKAKVICRLIVILIGSRRLPTEAPNANAARDLRNLSVAQAGNLR